MRVRSRFLNNLLNMFFCATCWEDDPNNLGGSDDGTPAFSGEFQDIKDPKTGKAVKVPKEIALSIQEVIGHSISTTRDTVKSEYKEVMDELAKLKSDNEELTQVKEAFERLKDSQLSEQEKIEKDAKRVIDEHKKVAENKIKEAEKWKSLFEKSTIKNDILSSFGDTKLYNPEQVAWIFEKEGNANLREKIDGNGKPTGIFETIVSLKLEDNDGKPEEIEGTPAEVFKRWIDLERNFHHRQNELPPGGGTPPAGKGSSGKIDFSGLKSTDKLNKAREMGIGSK
jgi:hypothetical protein